MGTRLISLALLTAAHMKRTKKHLQWFSFWLPCTPSHTQYGCPFGFPSTSPTTCGDVFQKPNRNGHKPRPPGAWPLHFFRFLFRRGLWRRGRPHATLGRDEETGRRVEPDVSQNRGVSNMDFDGPIWVAQRRRADVVLC